MDSCETPSERHTLSIQSCLENSVHASCDYNLYPPSTALLTALQYANLRPFHEQRETTAIRSGERPQTPTCTMDSRIDTVTPETLAFSVIRFLPVPPLLLNGLKTVVVANEVMRILLGLVEEYPVHQASCPVTNVLQGKTLAQLGVDISSQSNPDKAS